LKLRESLLLIKESYFVESWHHNQWLIKWEEIWTFINVNGVKVALQKLRRLGGKQKGPGLLSLDLEKWK
jgi:hypothetical protein